MRGFAFSSLLMERKPRKPVRFDFYKSPVIGDKSISSIDDPPKRGSVTQKFAARRRKSPTKAEAELEKILNTMDAGIWSGRFQREWAFAGKWIIDFYFHEYRFGIEVDGSYHETEKQKARDAEKARACEKFQITLLRLKNGEIFGDRESLLSKIRDGLTLAKENLAKNSEVKAAPDVPPLTGHENDLLRRHFEFYKSLANGTRQPETDKQKHFVAVCQGQILPQTEHEIAFAKFIKIQLSKIKKKI